MSIKDLFNKNYPEKFLDAKSQEERGAEAESDGNIKAAIAEDNRFIPQVDFSIPDNFARYGSAEQYYNDAIGRIVNSYPYDGSLKERTEFRNESTYLDLYVLDNLYPRTNGYVTFGGNSYIAVKGGPNEAPPEHINKETPEKFDKANIYDVEDNRESNLEMDFESGMTVEFWMKRENGSDSTVFKLRGSSGLFQVECKNNLQFDVILASGSSSHTFTFASLSPPADDWNHLAFTVKSEATETTVKQYLNGDLISSSINSTIFSKVPSPHSAFLASLAFTGSLDEFRFWKTTRTSEEIGRNWFTHVGGGTNTDLANTDLGVYFKFNEGITGDSITDSTILDYSGRFSNGSWTGYDGITNFRSTGSAIVEASAAIREFKDPIVYEEHPDVITLKENLTRSGSAHDFQNNASIYHTMPDWIIDEDRVDNGDTLLKLTQVMSSYFDTLHLQIEALPTLKDMSYPLLDKDEKPNILSKHLLEGYGMITPEIFANADVINTILNRDEDRNFDLDLNDIKNTIYKNIYNNLLYIYKTKGTSKTFRNLIRCYGVDDSLIRLNLYGNNTQVEVNEDKFRVDTVKKKYIDFNGPDRFDGSVYQQTSSDANSISFISASATAKYTSFTLESEVIFPMKLDQTHESYFSTNFVTSSLFGFHGADASDGANFTWQDPDIRVYAVRDEVESKNVKFILTSSHGSINLETDTYIDTYENEKWNFAIRYRPAYGAGAVLNADLQDYTLEFYGINSEAGVNKNEFLLTASLPPSSVGQSFLTQAKRVYAGAHVTNFTGSNINMTDVKISSVRYWGSYLDNDVIKTHARDPQNYGTLNPSKNTYLWPSQLEDIRIPEVETLFLDWEFNQVSSSDAAGQFSVIDFSSGSSDDTGRYGWYSQVSKKLHTGVGDFFIENDTKVADLKYIYAGKQLPPEQISEADLVNIMSQDDNTFTRQTRPIQYYYAFEKSMYQAITDEMLNIFATVTDFNNLIGDPVNRYRQEYKSMKKLRALFFERVGAGADLDKFVDFYKWIDDSLNKFLEQLIPASANFSDSIRNMVESHVLERNKYWTKFPTLEMMQEDPEAALRGVNEVSYDWKHGHAPIPMVDNKHCLWQDVKRIPENANRTKIYQAKKSIFDRKLNTPYKLDQSVVDSETLSFRNRNTGFVKSTLKIGGSEELKIKQSNIVQEVDCIDFDDLGLKDKTGFSLERTGDETDYTSPKGDIAAPFSLYVDEDGKLTTSIGNYGLKNYHNDSYNQGFGDFSAPMQSPFTEKFVGGNQHRHAELFEAPATRPEPWKLETSVGEVKIVTQALNSPRAIYYRDFVAKRPVNIKNIKTNSLGNYSKDFEIVHTMGRYENNAHFVKSEGFDLTTEYISSSFPGSPLSDVEKVIRGRTEHVFVNRFSAPGDPSTMGDSDGGWGLDRYSGEYSPNNDMNSRNLDVRSVNNGILSSHVNQFGYFSGINVKEAAGSSVNALDYSGDGSPYQVNRNAEYHPTSNVPESSCGTKYDNYYIQHNIPRNDYRYAWITASAISEQCTTASGDMQLVSASNFGSYAASPRTWGAPTTGILLNETFTSQSLFNANKGLDPAIWDIQSSGAVFGAMNLRQSNAGSNWILGFGGGNNTAPIPPRYISTVQTYLAPLTVTFKYCHGEFQDAPGPSPKYDLDAPSLIEPLEFCYSQDAGLSWITQSVLLYDHANQGDTRVAAGLDPFFTHTAHFPESSGTLMFKWQQVAYSSAGGLEDNWGLDDVNITLPNFLYTDFVGLKTHIDEPIFSLEGQIGYSAETPLITSPATSPQYLNRTFVPDTITDSDPIYGAQLFNGLILHRQGPYGWPSWKQIRGDQNPLTRYYRANNTITTNPPNKDYLTTINAGTTAVQSDLLPLERYQETPVLSKYKDLTLEIIVATYVDKSEAPSGDVEKVKNNIRLSLPYGNNLSSFSNARLVQLTNLIKDTKQSFDTLKEYYIGDSIDLDANPIDAFVSLKYPEIVYPAEANWATGKIRSRTQFECKFWKDSRTDRNLVNSSTNSQNIQSGTLVLDSASFGGLGTDDDITYLTCFSQSMWPLDARMNFETADTAYDWVTIVGTSSNNTCGNVGAFYPHYHGGEGELQSPAPQLHGQMEVVTLQGSPICNRPLFSGLQYHRRQTLPMSASTMAFSGYGRGFDLDGFGGSVSATSDVITPTSSISRIFGGDTKWEAGTQSGKNPFYYKDYDHYLEDMKGKTHGYSILPEFRISEHMERYIQEDNFLSTGSGLFTITGSDIETSGEEDFYKVYSHSDFMKHFEVLDSDHKSEGIKLKCRALKKFIPYDGFYPANRCIQLGTLFSQSYSKHVNNYKDIKDLGAGAFDPTAQMDNTQTNIWNTYLQPFMKPGILFNAIKSGVAVDYPIFTGSFSTIDLEGKLPDISPDVEIPYTGSFINELFFHKRIPFEALINPEFYMKNTPIVNMEPHPSASTNTTASWDGQGNALYKRAMNNFLAEVPEFFLKGSNMTAFVSAPEEEFDVAISGKTYSALVKLEKSTKTQDPVYYSTADNKWSKETSDFVINDPISYAPETITMYDRPSAFGPPSTAQIVSSSFYGVDLDHDGSGLLKNHGGSNNGYNMPFTPPYYDGSAWAIMSFTTPASWTESRIPTVDDITNNLDIQYIRALTGANATTLKADYVTNNFEYNLFNVSHTYNHNNSTPACAGIVLKSAGTPLNSKIITIKIPGYSDIIGTGGTEWVPTTSTTLTCERIANWINGLEHPRIIAYTYTVIGHPCVIFEAIPISGETGDNYTISFTAAGIVGCVVEVPKVNITCEAASTDIAFYNGAVNTADCLTSPTIASVTDWIRAGSTSDSKITGSEFILYNNGVTTIQTPNPYYNMLYGPQMGGVLVYSPNSEGNYDVCDGSIDIINQNAMQLSASVNLRQKISTPSTVYNALTGESLTVDADPNKKTQRWAIQTKFETPILNFIDSDITLPDSGSESCAKGMWHQYGRLPKQTGENPEGVFLEISDVPEALYNTLGITQPESLANLVGFETGRSPLGQVAESKEISEAVVAVPFIIKNGKKNFFKLPKITTQKYIAQDKNNSPIQSVPDTVSKMVRKMGNYMFPPTMDFYNNESIDPFAMYIFEFKHTLSQQDLADIWQNLPPEIGTKFEEQEVSISHPLLSTQMKLLSSAKLKQGKLRWMVFKVKKKAKKDYRSKVYGTETIESPIGTAPAPSISLDGDNIVSKNNVPSYSYNWPYDYFSLIELAQIEEEITFVEKSPLSPTGVLAPTDLTNSDTSGVGGTDVDNLSPLEEEEEL